VTATTGKAAAQINGHTVHSALHVPMRAKDKGNLNPKTLSQFQEAMLRVTHVIIGKFSMMSAEVLHWIQERHQEAKGNSDFFVWLKSEQLGHRNDGFFACKKGCDVEGFCVATSIGSIGYSRVYLP